MKQFIIDPAKEYPKIQYSYGPKINAVLESWPIEDDLIVFKYKVDMNKAYAAPLWYHDYMGPKKIDIQGFCNKEAMREFLACEVGTLKKLPLDLVTKESLAETAKFGFLLDDELSLKIVAKPFEEFQKNGLDTDLLVRIDYESHTVFDRKERPLPVGHFFEYITAGITDQDFDLKKALEILNKHPRVRFAQPDGNYAAGGGKIIDIPYYNRSSARSQFLSFMFEPTKDETEVLWETQKKMNKKFPGIMFVQAVMELDVLGLVSGGAKLAKRREETLDDDSD